MKKFLIIFCFLFVSAMFSVGMSCAKTFNITEFNQRLLKVQQSFDPSASCEVLSNGGLISKIPVNSTCEKVILGNKVCYGNCRCLYTYVSYGGSCVKYDCDDYPYAQCPSVGVLAGSCVSCPHDSGRFNFSCDTAKGWVQDGINCRCNTAAGLIQSGSSCVCDEDVRGFTGAPPNCSCKPCPSGYSTTTLTCGLNTHLTTSGISCDSPCNKCANNTCSEGNVTSVSECGGTASAWRLQPYSILSDGTICRRCYCTNDALCRACVPSGYTLITEDMSAGEIQNLFVAGAKLILSSNISVPSGIKITAANIVFDGNGYTLSSSGTDVAAITVEGKGASAEVKNIKISATGLRAIGVKAIGGGKLTIDNLDGITVTGAESKKYYYRDEALFTGESNTSLLKAEANPNATIVTYAYVPKAISQYGNTSSIFGAGTWYVGAIGEWTDLYGYDYSAVSADLGFDGATTSNNIATLDAALTVIKAKMSANLMYEWADFGGYWTSNEAVTTSAWLFNVNNGQRTYDYKRENDNKHLRFFHHTKNAFNPSAASIPAVGNIMYADGTWGAATSSALNAKIAGGIYPVGVIFDVITLDGSVKIVSLDYDDYASFGSSSVNYTSLTDFSSTKTLYNTGKLIVKHQMSQGFVDYCSSTCVGYTLTSCPAGYSCDACGGKYKATGCASGYSCSTCPEGATCGGSNSCRSITSCGSYRTASGCSCVCSTTYPLTVCPDNGNCSGGDGCWKLTSCKSGYTQSGNTCVEADEDLMCNYDGNCEKYCQYDCENYPEQDECQGSASGCEFYVGNCSTCNFETSSVCNDTNCMRWCSNSCFNSNIAGSGCSTYKSNCEFDLSKQVCQGCGYY